ncbi:MAG: hypothetical protein ABIR91_05160 [Candidatus Saccharimonadales bacterium]
MATKQNTYSKKPNSPSKAAQILQTTTTPGVTVLQWLTYAFWGWTLVSLSILVFMVVYNLIRQTDVSDTVPYAIAATVVLLPISIICDVLYRRHETPKKQGATMLIMVIHAVIFALFSIGSLIGALLAVVQMMISASSDTSGNVATAISLTIVALLYAVTFVRTLNPFHKIINKVSLLYIAIMGAVTAIFIILAVAGPVVQSVQTKTDRLIANNLPQLNYAIGDYIRESKKLPVSLNDISLDADTQQLVDEKLVRYIANTPDSKEKTFRYQLCTTYAHKDNQRSRYEPMTQSADTYRMDLSTYGHPAGDVCYKLQQEQSISDSNGMFKNFQ